MHRSLEAARRFFKFQQSASLLPSFQVDFTDLIAKKSNCKGTIDRKDNAEVTVSGFFSKRKVFRLSRRELFSSSTISAALFTLWATSPHFDAHRFPNSPPKTLRSLFREAIERSIVHVHGLDRQRGVTKLAINRSPFFIRITNIENMGLHSSGEQLP